MKKRVFNGLVLVLALATVVCSATSTALAATLREDATCAELISPRFTALKWFQVDLSISDSGQASCFVSAHANSSYTLQVTLELQQNSNGWRTIESKTFGEGNFISDGLSRYVYSGSTYRVLGTARVYDSKGNQVEVVPAQSNTVSY